MTNLEAQSVYFLAAAEKKRRQRYNKGARVTVKKTVREGLGGLSGKVVNVYDPTIPFDYDYEVRLDESGGNAEFKDSELR